MENNHLEEFKSKWQKEEAKAKKEFPLKGLKIIPDMVGIASETAEHLKWKSLFWMIRKDKKLRIFRHFLKHPIKYAKQFISSWRSGKSYKRSGDFFLYGLNSVEAFEKELQNENNLFVLGFSYCHKPFECPSGRFTSDCKHDLNNPVCKQCFIGKSIHLLPKKNTRHVLIPTVHHIGDELFKLVHQYPKKQIIFLITACEMTLEMFGDYGNMIGIKGIGVRLSGRICNTMKAFQLSEEGVKPGLTVVLEDTQEKILRWLAARRSA